MTAIILAAGRGGRLAGVTGDRPKCLARLGTSTLIERQVRMLRDTGVTSIAVVDGYQAPAVRAACGNAVTFVHNERYASTNSLYSLWLARDLLRDGFLVLNCDVLLHPQLLMDLVTAQYEDALLFQARPSGSAYSDEEMKVQVRGGCVVDIAKTMPPDRADGENIGIAKFGSAGSATLIEELDRLVAANAVMEWVPAAFASFCRRRPLFVVESRGFPWIEIDFPEDYWLACTHVLPAIDSERDSSLEERAAALAGPAARRSHHV